MTTSSAARCLSFWAREGVDASTVKRDATAPTGIYFVSTPKPATTSSYRRTGSAASLYGSEDLPGEAIRSAKILHVSGISQAISTKAADAVFDALAMAPRGGRPSLYDTNIRLKLWPIARARAVIHEAMTNIDIALPGLDDARLLVGVEDPDAIADRYLTFGARIVALKLGSQGCLIATSEQRLRIPPHRVEAVDATRRRRHVRRSVPRRNICLPENLPCRALRQPAAALATRGYGAVDPMPRRRNRDALTARDKA